MTGSELGVLRQVSYSGGPQRGRVKEPGDPPRNTSDIRHQLCTHHHLACDCREAELGEQISELRSDASDSARAIDGLKAIAFLHGPSSATYRSDLCQVCYSPWPCPTRVLIEAHLPGWYHADIDPGPAQEALRQARADVDQLRWKVDHAASALRNEDRLPTSRVARALEVLDPTAIEVPF